MSGAQSAPPTTARIAGAGVLAVSQQSIPPGTILEAVALKDASFALFLALPKETKTMEAKIPIMAITTNNSINVKPFFSILFKYNFNLDKL
jgi:hypothetical protein